MQASITYSLNHCLVNSRSLTENDKNLLGYAIKSFLFILSPRHQENTILLSEFGDLILQQYDNPKARYIANFLKSL